MAGGGGVQVGSRQGGDLAERQGLHRRANSSGALKTSPPRLEKSTQPIFATGSWLASSPSSTPECYRRVTPSSALERGFLIPVVCMCFVNIRAASSGVTMDVALPDLLLGLPRGASLLLMASLQKAGAPA